MNGTLYTNKGNYYVDHEQLEDLIKANMGGLVICLTAKDANKMSRAVDPERCRFIGQHMPEHFLGIDLTWAWVPEEAQLDKVWHERLRMRCRTLTPFRWP